MPPRQTGQRGGGAKSSKSKGKAASRKEKESDMDAQQFGSSEPEAEEEQQRTDEEEEAVEVEEEEEEESRAKATIPADLLTRLLHEFFDGERTRVTRDANAAVAKYMGVFVREAIARTAVERERGFLEVCVVPLTLPL
jgi:hypothetical protein